MNLDEINFKYLEINQNEDGSTYNVVLKVDNTTCKVSTMMFSETEKGTFLGLILDGTILGGRGIIETKED